MSHNSFQPFTLSCIHYVVCCNIQNVKIYPYCLEYISTFKYFTENFYERWL